MRTEHPGQCLLLVLLLLLLPPMLLRMVRVVLLLAGIAAITSIKNGMLCRLACTLYIFCIMYLYMHQLNS